jgi:cation-transporting ATPase F
MILAGAFGLFEWELALGAGLEQARTVAVNVVIVAELFYLFNCRSLRMSPFRLGFFGNVWALGGAALMLAAQALFTYAPAMNRFFQSAPVGLSSWARVAGVGLAVFLAVEAVKVLERRKR